MSGKPILIKLEMATGTPSSFPVVLKKVMEMPPPNILEGDDGKRKLRAVWAKTSSAEKKPKHVKKQKNKWCHINVSDVSEVSSVFNIVVQL